jgi:hypothetical protein
MKNNLSSVYKTLHAIYAKHLRKHKENGDSRQMCADSDESVHSFRFVSNTGPMIPDSHRSEATLRVSHKEVYGLSQGFRVPIASFFRSPSEGDAERRCSRRLFGQAGERRRGLSSFKLASPPVATRNGLAWPARIGAPNALD